MIWLTWRQLRTQALAVLAILAAAAVFFVITGLRMRHAYNADLAACKQPGVQCSVLLDRLQSAYDGPMRLFQLLMLAAPALVGIFWGAPLIATEFERGTHQMTWNQSVTPIRWLAVKLAVVGFATVAAVGAFSLLLTWWAGPLDRIADNPFDWNNFTTRDVVPLAYAAFAFALGAVLGLLTRRAIPAMALTLAVFVALQAVVATQVRPNLLPSTRASETVNAALLNQADGTEIGGGPDSSGPITVLVSGPPGAWVRSESRVEDSSGREITTSQVSPCVAALNPAAPESEFGACLAKYDLHVELTYQPVSNYWPLQWYEAGIYLGLAGLLGGACFWRIRRQRS